MYTDETELTDNERAAFAALSRDMMPGELLEERVVRSLRKQGHLGGRRGVHFSMNNVLRIAAGITLFAGGVATGQYMMTQSRQETAAAQELIRRANEPAQTRMSSPQQVKNAESVVAEREMWL